MKKKNRIVGLLLLAALAVWSHNIYKIFVGVFRSDQEVEVEYVQDELGFLDTTQSAVLDNPQFVYVDSYRDPFRDWLRPIKKPTPKMTNQTVKRTKEPEPGPPALRFSGVVQDESGVLAIIEAPDGKTHIIHENDVVLGVTIVEIEKSEIRCKFGKKEYQVKIGE